MNNPKEMIEFDSLVYSSNDKYMLFRVYLCIKTISVYTYSVDNILV